MKNKIKLRPILSEEAEIRLQGTNEKKLI